MLVLVIPAMVSLRLVLLFQNSQLLQSLQVCNKLRNPPSSLMQPPTVRSKNHPLFLSKIIPPTCAPAQKVISVQFKCSELGSCPCRTTSLQLAQYLIQSVHGQKTATLCLLTFTARDLTSHQSWLILARMSHNLTEAMQVFRWFFPANPAFHFCCTYLNQINDKSSMSSSLYHPALLHYILAISRPDEAVVGSRLLTPKVFLLLALLSLLSTSPTLVMLLRIFAF